MFSDRERTIRRSRTPGSKDVLVGVKDTLCKLFISAVGIQGPRCRVFGLTEPSLGGIYTFIFVTDIRLDLASDTVVADACVLPLTSNIIEVISSTLAELKEGILVEIKTVGEEMRAWKRLLPALTERCREWKHKNTCEYNVQGVPLSLEFADTPICSCGQGMGVDSFRRVKEWEAIANYATRAAIGPLFAVSYLDKITTETNKVFSNIPKAPGRCAMCSGSGKPNLQICSRCKRVGYCGLTCQQEDWKRHKRECR